MVTRLDGPGLDGPGLDNLVSNPVTVLLTCGASCPDAIVEGILLKLVSFFPNARPVEDVSENLHEVYCTLIDYFPTFILESVEGRYHIDVFLFRIGRFVQKTRRRFARASRQYIAWVIREQARPTAFKPVNKVRTGLIAIAGLSRLLPVQFNAFRRHGRFQVAGRQRRNTIQPVHGWHKRRMPVEIRLQ